MYSLNTLAHMLSGNGMSGSEKGLEYSFGRQSPQAEFSHLHLTEWDQGQSIRPEASLKGKC